MRSTMLSLGTLLTLTLASSPAGAQDWTVLSSGTTQDIHCINGHADNTPVVGNGGFFATSDVTHTIFTPQNVGTAANLLSTMTVGAVYVAGAQGQVRMAFSTTWLDRHLPSLEDFVVFSAANGSATAVGTGGSIYRTDNYGGSWAVQSSGTTYALHAGSDGSWVVGDHGTFIRTTDSGAHWTSHPTGTTANLYGIVALGSLTEVAVGEQGTIIRSLDGGLTWSPRVSGTTATLRAVDWDPAVPSKLYAVGDSGTVLRSLDSGGTWCRLDLGTTTNLYAVGAMGGNHCMVGGQGGLLMMTATNGGTCLSTAAVEPRSMAGGELLAWEGPSPDPVRARATIAFVAGRNDEIHVTVHDVNGRLVRRLFDGRVRAGERHTLPLAAAEWSPGVYFVRAQGSTIASTRPFVILR